MLNNSQKYFKVFISSGRTYIPIREVCEALGYNVSLKEENGISAIFVTKPNDKVILDITNQKVIDNGHEYYLYGNYIENALLMHDGKGYLEAGLFSDIFPVKLEYNSQGKPVSLSTINENNLSITTKKKDIDRKDIVIHLQYPHIEGLKDHLIQEKINSVFENAAANVENEGLKNANEIPNIGYEGQNKYQADLNYRIKYNQKDILSVILYDYQYAGGAHGSTTQTSYSFDLKTGKELSLRDLLNENTKYTEYIDSLIRNEIDKRVEKGDLAELTKFVSVGANPSYYLSNDGVVFYFQEYEYFPYAAGIQGFPIKFCLLKDKFMKEYEFLY